MMEHAYNPSICEVEVKGLQVRGHPELCNQSLSPVGGEQAFKSKLLFFHQEPLPSPALTLLGGGEKRVTAPHPHSNWPKVLPLPSLHLALSSVTFQSSCLFAHTMWPQVPCCCYNKTLAYYLCL